MIAPDPQPFPIDSLPSRGDPTAIALEDRDGTLRYAALEVAVGRLAHGLAGLGLAPGDRVASWLPKTRTACLMPLAAARAGLVHVPVNPILKRAQVAHLLSDSGAALLVTQPARAATLAAGDVPAGCRVVEEAELVGADTMPPSTAPVDTLAAILYTSGSTGAPKGVMLSHANLALGAVSVAQYLRLDPRSDRVLALLPLSFDYGLNQLLSGWAAGACVVPFDYLLPRDVVKAVERHGITTLAGVPPLWTQLLEVDWGAAGARLRRLTNSGGAMTRPMVAALRDRFPAAQLFAMYGLTEAFRSTFLDPALIDRHPDSIGRAIPFAEVMVVRPDGSACATGEPGELVHAGPLVAQGYWRDPVRTAERFRPAPAFSRYGGMAAWSGDTVVADADGLLRFVGRSDEMIKSAGNRVSPTEIEAAALAGGEVREAVAIGVPDDRLGQAIVLVVQAIGDPADAEARLRARLRVELPGFQQPSRYIWRDALPRNANGKLDRTRVKAEGTA